MSKFFTSIFYQCAFKIAIFSSSNAMLKKIYHISSKNDFAQSYQPVVWLFTFSQVNKKTHSHWHCALSQSSFYLYLLCKGMFLSPFSYLYFLTLKGILKLSNFTLPKLYYLFQTNRKHENLRFIPPKQRLSYFKNQSADVYV